MTAAFAEWSEPPYRAGQLLQWLYARRVTDWEAMTNLSKALRQRLREHWILDVIQPVRQQGSEDSTLKVLWQLADGAMVESVLIPANPALYGETSDRLTLCVSTQVGCAYGCAFCASGLQGWKRNLGAHEIVEQVLATERLLARPTPERSADIVHTLEETLPMRRVRARGPQAAISIPGGHVPSRGVGENETPATTSEPRDRAISNLVIMGMGEPLANYDNLLKALLILNAPWGGGIGARKITISTSGLAPQIRRLAEEPFQFRLAISLHGATDAVRSQIMPVNRKYPLAELAAACEYYLQTTGRVLTFEYILIAGINDGRDQIKPLADLAHRLRAKVNLIPYNTVEGLSWQRPAPEQQEDFLRALERLDVPATLRREKGGNIDAACGQLRLKTERELREAAAPNPSNAPAPS